MTNVPNKRITEANQILIALGLAAFLNTTAVDENFRRFNGHTQVNATDLRLIKYPNKESLIAIGERVMRRHEPIQALTAEQLESLGA